jgi:hypothetical protein
MTENWEREHRLTDNYTQIPHGMWTLDVSAGARCLLGWLHSHDDSFLPKLSFNHIRSAFGGSGQVAVWIDELVEAGFVQVVKDKNRHRYRLLAKPWNALAHRPAVKRPESGHLDESSDYRTVTVRNPDENCPESGHREDYVEDHGEDQLQMLTVPVSEKAPSDDFDAFWSLYPRKVGKEKARKVWGRLSKSVRADALWALPRHVGLWERRQVGAEFIPYPTSWLNAKRWEDDLSGELQHPVQPSRSAPGMGVIRAIMQNKQGELG